MESAPSGRMEREAQYEQHPPTFFTFSTAANLSLPARFIPVPVAKQHLQELIPVHGRRFQGGALAASLPAVVGLLDFGARTLSSPCQVLCREHPFWIVDPIIINGLIWSATKQYTFLQ